jgi:hypothetical protein
MWAQLEIHHLEPNRERYSTLRKGGVPILLDREVWGGRGGHHSARDTLVPIFYTQALF